MASTNSTRPNKRRKLLLVAVTCVLAEKHRRFRTSSAPAPLFLESAIFFSIFLRWSLIDTNFDHASSAETYKQQCSKTPEA